MASSSLPFALRSSLAEERDAAEIFIVDPTFADWPLGERALIESLGRWVDSRKTLTVLAQTSTSSRGTTSLRRLAAPVVPRGRAQRPGSKPMRAAELFLVAGLTTVRLLDAPQRGIASHRAIELADAAKTVDALLQRSDEAFPVDHSGALGTAPRAPIIMG